MKNVKKRISIFLALLMTLSLVPASVLSAAAADAYQVLFEPSSQIAEGVVCNGYGELGVTVVGEDVYHIIHYTGSGIEQLPGTYSDMPDLGEGYAAVRNADGKCGVIDAKGETAVKFEYDYITFAADGKTAMGLKYGADAVQYYQIDVAAGKAAQISESKYFSEDESGIAIDYNSETRLYNYVDANGKILFGGYDQASYFKNGHARVAIGGIHQVIDAVGNVVLSDAGQDYEIIDFDFDNLDVGVLKVQDRNNYKEGFVDLTGKVVVPMQHTAFGIKCNGYISAVDWNDGKYTNSVLYDAKFGAVIPAGQYTWISDVSADGTVWATNDNGAKAAILKIGGSSAPVTPAQPETANAMPTNDTLKVNGEVKDATVYKINDSNYFKIRDLAAVLSGTSKQFAVGYDADSKSVTATTGEGYELTGTELAGAAPSDQTATISNDTIIVNGAVAANITVYKIDGSNYFKLRDLGDALGFDVGWSAEEGMFINTEA